MTAEVTVPAYMEGSHVEVRIRDVRQTEALTRVAERQYSEYAEALRERNKKHGLW
jgi:hypothetical protein